MAQRQVRLIQASGFDAAKSFFQHVKAASHPAVYAELLRLLRSLSTGETVDRGDVTDKASALLCGHPDLVRCFHSFPPTSTRPRQPAKTTPRRRRRDPEESAAPRWPPSATTMTVTFVEPCCSWNG
jgi:histone deacetylase complex regulatory component SIN3